MNRMKRIRPRQASAGGITQPKPPDASINAAGDNQGEADLNDSELDIDDDDLDLDFSDDDDGDVPPTSAPVAGEPNKHRAEIEKLEKKIAELDKELRKAKAKSLKKKLKKRREKLLEKKAALEKDGA